MSKQNWEEAIEIISHPERNEEAISQGAQKLEAFLNSDEGRAAMRMLTASKRFVRIAEDEGGGGILKCTSWMVPACTHRGKRLACG